MVTEQKTSFEFSNKLSLRAEMALASLNLLNEEEIAQYNEKIDDILAATTYSTNINSNSNKKFIDSWATLFPDKLPTAMAVKSYIAVNLVKKAILKSGTVDLNNIGKYLGDLYYDAPQGEIILSASNHLLIQPLFISKINKAKFDDMKFIGDVSHPGFEDCEVN